MQIYNQIDATTYHVQLTNVPNNTISCDTQLDDLYNPNRLATLSNYYDNNLEPQVFDNYNALYECYNQSCVYSRRVSKIRQIYENKIAHLMAQKQNVNLLFFSSYLLLQELSIIVNLGAKIREVHLTDMLYTDFLSNNLFKNSLLQFMIFTKSNNLCFDVYIHTDPNKIINCTRLTRDIDLVAGLDIDIIGVNDLFNTRLLIKRIANNCLKIDGYMCISQNFTDQVDLCTYEIINGEIKLIETIDYVKNPYYYKYKTDTIILALYNPCVIVCLVISLILAYITTQKKLECASTPCKLFVTPLFAIILNVYCVIGIIYNYIFTKNNFKRKVLPINEILNK